MDDNRACPISSLNVGEAASLLTEVPGRSFLRTSALRRSLGSSLSSGAARRRLRVRHQAPKYGVRDAPLEAPQGLLARLALIYLLLAVVGPTPSVRSGLTYRDHVQGVVESLRLPAIESLWRTTSPLEVSSGAVPE